MLKWTIIFLLVSVVAALLGFKLIAGFAATVAKVLFFITTILFIIFVGRGISGYRRIRK